MLDDIQINIAGGLDIPLPKTVKVHQNFEQHRVDDVGAAINTKLTRSSMPFDAVFFIRETASIP